MELNLKDKLLTAQAIDNFTKPEFDPFEKAELINELILVRRKQCSKCSKKIVDGKSTAPKNKSSKFWCVKCAKVVEQLAFELNVPRKTLYEARKLVDANEQTVEAVRSGKISAEKATRIVQNIKDSDYETEMVNIAIDEDLTTREIESMVSEKNNPKLITSHGLNALLMASNNLKKAYVKLPKNCKKNIEVKDTIKLCKDLIKKIETK